MAIHNFNRPVSIIGIGQSDFGTPESTPSHKDMAIQDLWAWAAQSALEDAGVNPKDLDCLVTGQCLVSHYMGSSLGQQVPLTEWIGAPSLHAVRHEEACATGYFVLDAACNYVASGKYDIVLAVCADINTLWFPGYHPSYMLEPTKDFSEYQKWMDISRVPNDNAYYRFNGASCNTLTDEFVRVYLQEHDVSVKDMDEAMNSLALMERWHASRNPQAARRETFEDIAKSKGFDDPMEYLRSDLNPLFTRFVRMASFGVSANGAAAVVVCSSDIAKQFSKKPIQVYPSGVSCRTTNYPNSHHRMNIEACERAYAASDVRPEEIEYFQTGNLSIFEMIDSAEAAGYLPKGEGWKYAIDRRTAWNGDRPMNTDGGNGGRGHATGVDGLATACEVVRQMRGEAGERQMPTPPRIAMNRGMGGSHSTIATIFKVQE